ncbi:MAG: hypothetical protein CML13_05265 [Puniceicoccaceae bacterium]|nr:hypothetical protein [Puniceicoccaceae bacterium]|tara:strand:+ start:272 stop:793 length:522 start_codon:yes stop_codon:yes gene_type:complete
MHTQTIPDAAYRDALAWTDPSKFELPAEGSPQESQMLDRVEALFADYSRAGLAANVEKVYADKVYFRDAFRRLGSASEIREYMIEGLAPLEGSEFVFHKIVRSGGDFYIDWTMRLDFKKTPTGTWEESIGMTRMRFNSEGQVIFHQDYWDPTDIVYKRIPVAKQLIGYVKGKM